MKSIKTNTAIAKDNGEYADAGSVLTIPGDVSAERAKDLVDSKFAESFDPDADLEPEVKEETPKGKKG